MFKKILMIFILQQAFIIYFDGIIRFKVDDENKFEPLCQLLNSNNIQLQKVIVHNAINILNLANEKIYKNEVSYQESVIFFDMTKKLKDIFMCVCPPKSPLTITKGNSISKTIWNHDSNVFPPKFEFSHSYSF